MSKTLLLQDKFIESCQKYSDRIAFIQMQASSKKEFSYSDIYNLSKKIAAWLIDAKVNKKDTIAILLDNCPEWAAIYFAILFSGATVVPLDIKLSDFEIYNLLSDCQARAVFTSSKFVNFFDKNILNLPDLKKIVILDKEKSKSSYTTFNDIISTEKKSDIAFPQNSPDDIASIIYTSGTVGKPKGVELTNKNFSSNFQSLEKLRICSGKDCFISILPLHHAFAFTATLIFPLFLGAKIVYPQSIKSQDLLECMRKVSVSIFIAVPEVFNLINKNISDGINNTSFFKRLFLNLCLGLFWQIRRITNINLAKILLRSLHHKFGGALRLLISGGAKLDPYVARGFLRLGFTMLEGYGLTETSPVVSINLPQRFKIGSVGRPIEGVSVKLGENNEILICGDNVMKGYYKNPAETNAVIKDSWFYSGDSGFIDKDGFIFITGRIKEIIVLSSGKNIYPEEIESYFKKSDFIKEICLLPVRNAEGNEVLGAVVVPDFEHFKKIGDANVNRKIKWELENFSSQLPTYKRITDFVIAKEELPKTRLGKIKRYEVFSKHLGAFLNRQEAVEQDYAPSLDDVSILHSEIGIKLIDFLSKKLSLKKEIRLDDHLELDLGIDSLARVELAMGIQNMLKIEIPDSLMGEIFTVRDLILKISEAIYQAEATGEMPKPILSWTSLLNFPPSDELIEKIEFNPGGFNKLFSFIVVKVLFIIFKLFWGFKIVGKENLTAKGNFILCPNHASYFDGFVVASAIPFSMINNLYFLGDKNIFEHPSKKWALKMARLVPIDPTKELVNTLQVSSYILRNNKMLCIFPEGLRSFEGKPVEFKKGIGILVKELDMNLKIIPIAIKGTFQAWPRTRHFPRFFRPIKIVFGKPVEMEKLLSAGKKLGISDDYQAIATAIKKEVENLFYNN